MHLALIILLLVIVLCAARIPIILDTDIGMDIDDSWALAFLLESKEVDIKLVLTATHNTPEKVKLVAKFLDTVGRTEVPIGKGFWEDNQTGPNYGALYGWSTNYDLKKYPGKIYEDGVGAMIDIINNSPEPITIVEIAPCANIKQALTRDPSIQNKATIVAMSGSIQKAFPEYNVANNVVSAQMMYRAKWPMKSAPLDVTLLAQMKGAPYQKIQQSKSIVTQTMLGNYKYWCEHNDWCTNGHYDPRTNSSLLHDLLSASFVILGDKASTYFDFKTLPIVVNDTGFTLVQAGGHSVTEALFWKGGDAGIMRYFSWIADRFFST
jgi:inosine-uridine nucleoside N-ribohydrolase